MLIHRSDILNNRYQVIEEIAPDPLRGSLVYHAKDLLTGAEVAIKTPTTEVTLICLQREASFLKTLQHRQLPTFIEAFECGKQFYLVEEYLQGATLHELVRYQGYFSPQDARFLLTAVCSVLRFLHGNHILHLVLLALD